VLPWPHQSAPDAFGDRARGRAKFRDQEVGVVTEKWVGLLRVDHDHERRVRGALPHAMITEERVGGLLPVDHDHGSRVGRALPPAVIKEERGAGSCEWIMITESAWAEPCRPP
jgi:hypothetical protein